MAARRGYVTEAIVLRVIPYGETSQVAHLSTPDRGLVAALAKGAHRPAGEFQGGLALGAVGEAALSPRREDAMEVLRSFRATADLRGLGGNLERFHAACHVLEILRGWTRPALPQPTLHRAGVAALRILAGAEAPAVPGWVVWFEARAIAATGHRPRLAACPVCEQPLRGATFLSPPAGGLVHEACAPEGPRRRAGAAAVDALRRLYASRLADLAAEPLTPAEVRAARVAHDLLLPWILERKPATLDTVPRP